MENITNSLDIIYHTIETLLSIENDNLDIQQKVAILRSIEELEEVRRLLYNEKNNIRESTLKN